MGEQGKINQPEHTAGGSQNKGTEKLQRRAGPSPLEVGGRGEGRGKQPQRRHPLPHCKQARFLSKDFLRPDWQRALGPRREKARCTRGEGTQASGCPGCSPRREKARRTRGEGTQVSGCQSRSPRREKARCTWGEGAQASGCLGRSGPGRHKTQAQPNPRFCGGPKNWNRTQRRAHSM